MGRFRPAPAERRNISGKGVGGGTGVGVGVDAGLGVGIAVGEGVPVGSGAGTGRAVGVDIGGRTGVRVFGSKAAPCPPQAVPTTINATRIPQPAWAFFMPSLSDAS